MKKVTLGLFFISLSLALSLSLPVAAQEEGNILTTGAEVTGELSPENFAQTYIFVGSTDDAVTIDAVADSAELAIALLLIAPDGTLVAQDSDLSTPDEAIIGDFALPQDGQYVVTILRGEGASGEAEGGYTLALSGELTEPAATVATEPADTTTVPTIATEGTVTLATGGIDLALEWAAAVNLDMEVRDPQGGAIFSTQTASPSGGQLAGDVNADCATATADTPTENVVWENNTVPVGSYEIIIYYVNGCTVGGPQQFNLSARVNDEDIKTLVGTLNPNQRYLAALEVNEDGTWTLYNGGVNAGLDVSLLSTQIGTAQPFPGVLASGNLNRDIPAIAYTLEGVQGDSITLNMDALNGNLDPYLILLNPTGVEIARNDDRIEGNTNSTISQTLPQSGIYTIVATRYGQTIGGTEGDFNLTLSLSIAGVATPAPVVGTDTTTAVTGTDTTATTGTDTTVTGTDTTLTTTSTTIRPEGLPAGSVEVILTWATGADVQLLVRDPAGAAIFDDTPTAPSGGILQSNGNVGCAGNASPVSYVYWPASRLPRGLYEIDVWYQNTCDDPNPLTFNLVVNVQGQEIINTTQPATADSHFGITFEIDQDGNAIAYEGGFFDMEDASTINFFSLLATAEQVAYGETVPGSITAQERYQLYSFQGSDGDRVRISMQKTGGTLDTALFLISEQGSQLAANDDVTNPVTGERDTNSLIDTFELTATGTYYIIATHYGLQYGGTTGTYNMSLFELP